MIYLCNYMSSLFDTKPYMQPLVWMFENANRVNLCPLSLSQFASETRPNALEVNRLLSNLNYNHTPLLLFYVICASVKFCMNGIHC